MRELCSLLHARCPRAHLFIHVRHHHRRTPCPHCPSLPTCFYSSSGYLLSPSAHVVRVAELRLNNFRNNLSPFPAVDLEVAAEEGGKAEIGGGGGDN
ncbi:Os02g0530401 [Oryza sativa Japonica Group]|uniref:Os02g0530401 protein n=1 Tax=Oryza sativa subsp. japonica TaxID=39947 RepID=A0A0P0VJV5_ORYSJ|nr:Os02g0530401 [Oryza sativa Japonica Group]